MQQEIDNVKYNYVSCYFEDKEVTDENGNIKSTPICVGTSSEKFGNIPCLGRKEFLLPEGFDPTYYDYKQIWVKDYTRVICQKIKELQKTVIHRICHEQDKNLYLEIETREPQYYYRYQILNPLNLDVDTYSWVHQTKEKAQQACGNMLLRFKPIVEKISELEHSKMEDEE